LRRRAGSRPGGAFAQVSALLLPQRNNFLQRVRGKYISDKKTEIMS